MKYRDITPGVELMHAQFAQSIQWARAIGELLDNSIDSGAKWVRITVAPHEFRIEDDGGGTADPTLLVHLAGREDHESTRVGRYGIGAKDAICGIGGPDSEVFVESTKGGIRRRLHVSWRRMLKRGRWQIEWPEEEQARGGEHGTKIVIEPCTKPYRSVRMDKVLGDLGFIYSPAIKRGVCIEVVIDDEGPVVLERWTLPTFAEDLTETIEVDGKTAHVHAGIVAPGEPNTRPGISYLHQNLVIIKERKVNGFQVGNVCGYVQLGKEWHVTKNKNGLMHDGPALFAAVEEVLAPMLKRAQAQAMTHRCSALMGDVTSTINAALGVADEKAVRRRNDDPKKGTRNPTGKGGKHKRARERQPGSTFRGRGCGNFQIVLNNAGPDGGVGQVKGQHVYLNEGHPSILAAVREENKPALVSHAAWLIAAEACANEDPQLSIKGFRSSDISVDDLSNVVAAILDGVREVESAPVGAEAEEE